MRTLLRVQQIHQRGPNAQAAEQRKTAVQLRLPKHGNTPLSIVRWIPIEAGHDPSPWQMSRWLFMGSRRIGCASRKFTRAVAAQNLACLVPALIGLHSHDRFAALQRL